MKPSLWPKNELTYEEYYDLKPHIYDHVSDNVAIGRNVTIFPKVYIGDNTVIGDNSVIQYGAFIEHDCQIGQNSRIGTNAVLRRETIVGDNSILGNLTVSEGKNWIGNNVLIHSQCHLTTGLIIEDWVFMGPQSGAVNDHDILHGRRNLKQFIPQGPHIKFGARIGTQTLINPGVIVGRECLVGSASLVTKDLPDFSVAYGVPAKVVKEVEAKWRLPEKKFLEFQKRMPLETLKQLINKMIDSYRQQ